MTHRNRTHHRPSVRRLPERLGSMRWLVECQCGLYTTATFWKSALVTALIHSEVLK